MKRTRTVQQYSRKLKDEIRELVQEHVSVMSEISPLEIKSVGEWFTLRIICVFVYNSKEYTYSHSYACVQDMDLDVYANAANVAIHFAIDCAQSIGEGIVLK